MLRTHHVHFWLGQQSKEISQHYKIAFDGGKYTWK